MSQTTQFDKSISLFYLVFLTLDFSLAVYFLQLTQYVSIVTYNQALFFNNIFYSFDFIMLSDLNSVPNLVEILFARVFLVDCLMCLNISLTVLKMSKSSLS